MIVVSYAGYMHAAYTVEQARAGLIHDFSMMAIVEDDPTLKAAARANALVVSSLGYTAVATMGYDVRDTQTNRVVPPSHEVKQHRANEVALGRAFARHTWN